MKKKEIDEDELELDRLYEERKRTDKEPVWIFLFKCFAGVLVFLATIGVYGIIDRFFNFELLSLFCAGLTFFGGGYLIAKTFYML